MSASHWFERCSVGIQYAIVARNSLDVMPIADAVLERVAGSDAPVTNAERARIDDADYLRLLGVSRSHCQAGAAWWEIAERLDRRGSRYSGWWRSALEFNLSRGPLARRLLRAVGPRPDRAALHELYSALCDALRAGKPFDP